MAYWKKVSLIAALFIGLIGIFFARSISSGNFLLPINSFYEFDPVFKIADFVAHDQLNTDISMQFLPYRALSENSKITFWNPYSLGGLPFFEDIQSRSLEASNLLANLLHVSLNYFLFFSTFLLLLFGAVSMYLFIRALGLRSLSAIFGAIAFVFSSPVIIWINYTLGVSFIWLPFLFFCVEKIYQKNNYFFPLLALATAWLIFAGHPQAAFLSLLFVSAYVLYKLFKAGRKSWAIAALTFLFIGFGLGLSAVQSGPAFFYLKQSEVYNIGRSLNHGSILSTAKQQLVDFSGSLHLLRERLQNRLILMVAPRYFGDVVSRNYHYPEQPLFYNFFETASYAGILTLLLAIFSIFFARQRKLFFWIISAALTLALTFNLPFFNDLSLLPILDKVDLGRLIFLLVFCLAILAAYGLEEIMLIAEAKKVKSSRILAGALILTVILFLDLYQASAYLQDSKAVSFQSFKNNDVVKFLSAAGQDRYVGLGQAGLNINTPLIPNQSMIYGLYDLRGYFVSLPDRFFKLSQPYVSRKRNFYFFDDIYNRNFLDIYSVKYIICPNNICGKYEADYPAAYAAANVKILQNNQAWPKAFVTYNYKTSALNITNDQHTLADKNFNINYPLPVENFKDNFSLNQVDPAIIESYEPDKVVISAQAKSHGLLVLTDNYYDGWSATVNGQEVKIIPVLGSLRGVPLVEGNNIVIFRYLPTKFYQFLGLSLLSLLGIILTFLFVTHQTRKENHRRAL